MAKTIDEAVREICLSFPEAEEAPSHGWPNFKVRGKSFAMYTVNHHGDGRVSLWLSSPPGAQDIHVRGEPKHFFVPPYVGPNGWLGLDVHDRIDESELRDLALASYHHFANKRMLAALDVPSGAAAPRSKAKRKS